MNYDDCDYGLAVRIVIPGSILDGETGIISNMYGTDEVEVRFDVYKPKFDQYEDTRRGCVVVDPSELTVI